MPFIENFRAITDNKLPNNFPIKPQTPVFERPKVSEETKNAWAEAEEWFRNRELNEFINKESQAEASAVAGTISDRMSKDPSFNLVFKHPDVINNKDALIGVINDLEKQNNWNGILNAAEEASKKFAKSAGIMSWFDIIGKELGQMKEQYDASEGKQYITPKYFLDDMRSMLEDIDTNKPRLV